MKNKFDIADIRKLLHKYYEAETTPDEEQLLVDFFSKTIIEEIPEDLEDDRELFSSLSRISSHHDDIEIPYALREKLTQFSWISAEYPASKKQKSWSRRTAYVATACACLMLALFMRWMYTPSEIHTKSSKHTVETHKEISAKIIKSETETEIEIESPISPCNYNPVRTQVSKELAENTNKPQYQEDGFIEITDPEEAVMIVMEIGLLLTDNTQKTNKTLKHLEKLVYEHKELTKSILQ